MQLSVSVHFQRLKHNPAGETRIELPNSLFRDLAACFDRIAAGLKAIFVRDLDIACVHDLLRMNVLFRFKGFFIKRHNARLRYRRSNSNPLIGAPSPTLSVHSLNLRNLFLYYNRHIHSFVSVEWVVRRVLPLWISLSQRGPVAILSDLVSLELSRMNLRFSEKVVV